MFVRRRVTGFRSGPGIATMRTDEKAFTDLPFKPGIFYTHGMTTKIT